MKQEGNDPIDERATMVMAAEVKLDLGLDLKYQFLNKNSHNKWIIDLSLYTQYELYGTGYMGRILKLVEIFENIVYG